jgi:creatinine amidohydrolase
MPDREVRLENLTRLEFREALAAGHFKAAIIATGSVEQHLEHLAMSQDIASSTYVAERVAERHYPNVVVTVPMAIGVSEHHMGFAGTLTTKPGGWLAVLFDAVESLVRHGIRRVLILNGHGGNVKPVQGVIDQWRLHLTSVHGTPISDESAAGIHTHSDYTGALVQRDEPGVDLRFNSYWDLIPDEFANDVLDVGHHPGHAGEFETSFAMHAFPGNVRADAVQHNLDAETAAGTAEKGRVLIDKAVEGTTALLEEMLACQ